MPKPEIRIDKETGRLRVTFANPAFDFILPENQPETGVKVCSENVVEGAFVRSRLNPHNGLGVIMQVMSTSRTVVVAYTGGPKVRAKFRLYRLRHLEGSGLEYAGA